MPALPVTVYYRRLFVLSAAIGALLAGLHYFELLGPYPSFSWVCLAFFAAVTPLVVGLASMANATSTPSRSVYVVLGAMIFKFMLCVMMIILYYLAVRPDGPRFAGPFFLFYIVYAIVETRFLLQLVSSTETRVRS